MKLTTELKKRIDDYFDNISPEELFEISISKYKFKENLLHKVAEGTFQKNPIGLINKRFETKSVHLFSSKKYSDVNFNSETDNSDYNKAA